MEEETLYSLPSVSMDFSGPAKNRSRSYHPYRSSSSPRLPKLLSGIPEVTSRSGMSPAAISASS